MSALTPPSISKGEKRQIRRILLSKLLGFNLTEINNTFLIKVNGVRDGIKYNTLVGVTGLIDAVGFCYSRKMLKRAFKLDKNDGKEICKLRSGLKVTFYYK
jgi:hypothetical protein